LTLPRRRLCTHGAAGGDEVRAGEVIAALCLATDLGMGLAFENGLHSTLVAGKSWSFLIST
jgi:hypothetical protein